MRTFIGVALLCALCCSLPAQTFRGGIQGTVTDSSGAAITGAEVTVKSEATGLVRTVQTDATGNFLVTELPLGSYRVSATKTGFGTKALTGVNVAVTVITRADIQL